MAALAFYKEHPDDDPEELANTVVSLSACTKEMNTPDFHMYYAQWQLQIRRDHPSEDILYNGMAYNQYASACAQPGRHQEAINLAEQGWLINVTSPEYLAGKYYPFYAMLYQALSLMALERNEEAAVKLTDAITWRELKYGVDDTRSFQ